MTEPALITYVTTRSKKDRTVAFLRTYAERIRNGTDITWEIPNTRADTIQDIANFIEALKSEEEIADQNVAAFEPLFKQLIEYAKAKKDFDAHKAESTRRMEWYDRYGRLCKAEAWLIAFAESVIEKGKQLRGE